MADTDPSAGTLTASTKQSSLNEPLDVFTPDRAVDRLVFTKLGGFGETDIQVIDVGVTAPVITSAATAPATAGQPFSYQITATNNPTAFGVQGLPTGLAVNSKTGLISGTPKGAGKFPLTLNAYNRVGYGVTGLPPGLSVGGSTGLISGTPKNDGKFTLNMNAYNSAGKGSKPLTLTVQPGAPPAITSSTTANGKVGVAFSYQIVATNHPTTYGVQGLPLGLSNNAGTGVISGTPKAAGMYPMTLNVYNSAGKGSQPLTLTITK